MQGLDAAAHGNVCEDAACIAWRHVPAVRCIARGDRIGAIRVVRDNGNGERVGDIQGFTRTEMTGLDAAEVGECYCGWLWFIHAATLT